MFAAILALPALLPAQTTFTETFTQTTAPGWVFGGNYTPNLTANTIDAPGDGWLRLTDNANNRATYALLDTEIFSVNARIEITMDYAFYNGTGADGITFFLVDGAINASTFAPGAYGGSMGYAQGHGLPGMTGGYLGFAFDNYGNYTNPTEDRVGGPGFIPNNVSVRGPQSSNYAYINGASLNSYGQMDFPTATTRPDQTGADYRSFKIILDANNQLQVLMQFGAAGTYQSVFTADLAGYERPETFKIGFTGATGGSTEIHEIRNVSLVSTPWSTGSGAYEWDDAAGDDNWGSTAGGEGNSNWYSSIPGDDNKTPLRDSDILFGSRPSSGPQTVNVNNPVEVRNLTFDSPHDYTLSGSTITFGDTGKAGLPSINVNNYNDEGANGRHKINNALTIVENIAIRNFSYSSLCLNGAMNLGAHTLTTSGYGLTNLNGQITGSGPIVVNGASTTHGTATGIVTISGNNAATYTGAITVNGGQLVALHNGALGNTGSGTTVNDGGTLTFRGGVTTPENITLRGSGTRVGMSQYAGAIYNDGGDNILSGSVTLAANAAIGSRAGNLTLNGVVGQSGGARTLTKIGDGVVTLNNTGNNYAGATIIEGGALRITNGANALPGGFATGGASGGNLTLKGGVLEIGFAGADFTRRLGASDDRVQWTGDGGFSAHGGDRTVSLVNSGGTANGPLTWDSGSFVPAGHALLLSSDYANGNLTLTNAIALAGATTTLREVRVADGSAAVDGTLSGAITGNGGLLKTGDGTLALTGTNSHSGATEIRAGALRGNLSASSNLQLAGGVREISGNTSLALGSAAGQVRWTGDGGFAAVAGAHTVTLDSGADLAWGATGNFVAAGNRLVLGSRSADNTATLTNNLGLGASGARTIETIRGTSSTVASGALSGVVSGAADLAVAGNGRLDLAAANTHTGAVTITGSEVRLSGASGSLAASSGFTVQKGGALVLDNAASANANRLGDTAPVALSGGRIDFLGTNTNGAYNGTTTTAETAGALALAAGANQINVGAGSHAWSFWIFSGTQVNPANLTFSGLARSAGSTLEFTRSGSGAFGTDATVRFTTAPALEQGILAYAVAGDGATPTGFATHSGNGSAITVAAGADTAQGSWNASTIAAPTTDQTLDANRTVGALVLGSGIDVAQSGGSRALTVQTGGILSTGATASNISTAVLNVGGSGNRELVTHVYGSGGLNISASIQNNANTTGLTKSGDGVLTLSGSTANTHTGVTTVNAGTLVLDKTAGVAAITGDGDTANNATVHDLVIGDGRGTDTVKLLASEQIANTASVALRGGEVGNHANRAVLNLNGRTETFHTLKIEGNSVLDFSGGDPCAPTFLYLDVLNIASDALLTITNWIEFTDFLLVKKTTFDSEDLGRVVFDGYDDAASWKDYDSDYYQIVPYAPVPEPASAGLLALGGLTGCALLRRRRRT